MEGKLAPPLRQFFPCKIYRFWTVHLKYSFETSPEPPQQNLIQFPDSRPIHQDIKRRSLQVKSENASVDTCRRKQPITDWEHGSSPPIRYRLFHESQKMDKRDYLQRPEGSNSYNALRWHLQLRENRPETTSGRHRSVSFGGDHPHSDERWIPWYESVEVLLWVVHVWVSWSENKSISFDCDFRLNSNMVHCMKTYRLGVPNFAPLMYSPILQARICRLFGD